MGSRKSRHHTATVLGGFTAAEAIVRTGRYIYADAISSLAESSLFVNEWLARKKSDGYHYYLFKLK